MRLKGFRRAIVFAISLLVCWMVLVAGELAFAETIAGTVSHLSGPLFAKKADGSIKSLSVKSQVAQGDTLITEKRTYGRIKFLDNSELTLRPNTQITISKYFFDKGKPKEDNAVYDLAKGGLRAVTGAIGKRGNQESYKMKTPVATIGIRGTVYDCRLCEKDCGDLPEGLYVRVVDGGVSVDNSAGGLTAGVGQHVYVANDAAKPQIVPGSLDLDFSEPEEKEYLWGTVNIGCDCIVR